MVVYVIAAAGCIGSLIGAFFQLRWLALLWAMPVVCALYGAVVFTGPLIKANPEAPARLVEVMTLLGDLSLLVPVLVAAAAGALFASSLVGYVRTQQVPGDEYDEGEARPRAAKPILSRGRPSNRLLERAEDIRTRRAPPAPVFTPPPVYEVVPEPRLIEERPASAPSQSPRALGESLPADIEANRRREGRRRTLLAGELVFDDGLTMPCTIADLSTGGARVRLVSSWPKSGLLSLLDHSNGLGHEVALRWRAGPFAGLRFTRSYSLQPRDA